MPDGGPELTLITPGRGAVPAPVRGVPDLQPRMRRCRPRARPGELTRRGRAVIPDRGRFRRAVFSGAPLGVRPRGSAPPLGESNQAPSHQAGPVHLGPGDVAGPALGLPPRPDLSRVREIARLNARTSGSGNYTPVSRRSRGSGCVLANRAASLAPFPDAAARPPRELPSRRPRDRAAGEVRDGVRVPDRDPPGCSPVPAAHPTSRPSFVSSTAAIPRQGQGIGEVGAAYR